MKNWTRFAAAIVLLTAFTNALAQSEIERASRTDKFRITFSGNTPVQEWISAAKLLVDAGVVPVTSAETQPGDTICAVALRELNFKDQGLACTKELNDYLVQLNKGWKPGMPVYYPALPVAETEKTFTYPAEGADAARAKLRAVQAKSRLKEEAQGGRFDSQTFKVLKSDIEFKPSPKANEVLPQLNLYDPKTQSLERSVERIGKPAAVGALHSRAATLSQWWPKNCVPGARAALPKPPFIAFLGLPRNDACVSACVDDKCPEIVLYDTEVAQHWDLLAALGLSRPANSDAQLACSYQEWADQFHGTHLAGIMVSQASPVSAAGLAPNARLASIDNRAHALGDLGSTLEARKMRAASARQIFVVASDFPREDWESATFPDGRQRLRTPAINDSIMSGKNILWVVSAGQPKHAPGEELSTKDNRSPMNLGDMDNVIVVTACERCLEEDPDIAQWANFSRDLVSVAAPGGTAGEDVYSTASTNAYSKNYGTSQSAAFVAGLAAAMYSCNSQLDALSVKKRLEATSTPVIVPYSSARDTRVRAGVINAAAALRDPRFGWLRTLSRGDGKFTNISWCVESIPLQPVGSADLRDSFLVSGKVRRILKMSRSAAHPEGYMFHMPWGWTDALARMKLTAPQLLRVKFAGDSEYSTISANDIEDLDVATAAIDPVTKCDQ